MAILNGATASPRVLYAGVAPSSTTTVYTAPNQSTNVTSPSSTAYIKEITICNYSASTVAITIWVNGVALINNLSINASDTKVLSGLNTMINVGGIISVGAGVANAISLVISGVEVQ